ncbi:MAG: LemA family protein [Oscillospiraceae bacterium]
MSIGLIIGIILAVVVVIVIAVVVWFVGGQNRLVHAEELCGNALSQIGVQQASRWDALNTLADLTKGYSDQEYNTLMQTIRARQGISPKSSAKEVEEQEAMIQQGIGRINALAEAYPDLKSNTLYLKTMDEVKNHEDNVRMSRMVYNDTVTKYNRLVRSLPGSLLAGGLGFAPRDYLQQDPAKADMPVLAR